MVHCKIGKRARSPIEFSSVCPASALIPVIQSISGTLLHREGPSPELPALPWLNGDLTTRQARHPVPHEGELRCLGRGRRVAVVGAVETAPFRVDERPAAGNPSVLLNLVLTTMRFSAIVLSATVLAKADAPRAGASLWAGAILVSAGVIAFATSPPPIKERRPSRKAHVSDPIPEEEA